VFISAAEINAKPVVLVIGPWSTGKSTIINYLLDIEDSQNALYTGFAHYLCIFANILYCNKSGFSLLRCI